jgi:N-methylhydantoinase A/oxoprolinase/acetone carboxylase beta subunit
MIDCTIISFFPSCSPASRPPFALAMVSGSYFKIGVDVGGTNTDAALLSFSPDSGSFEVVSTSKSPAASSITSGITTVLSTLLSTTAIDRSCIRSITVGTTAFVNALVERDSDVLERVAVLRLCGPYLKDIPPFALWPDELRVCCDGGYTVADGGLEIYGSAIVELDEDAIAAEARRMSESGIRHVAVVGVFSPLDNEGKQEYRVREIFKQVAPEMTVVCSRDVGNVGLCDFHAVSPTLFFPADQW